MQEPHDQQDDPNRPRGNRPARGARVVTPGELVQGALQQQGGDGDFLGLGRTAGDLVGMAQELEDQASQRAPLRLSGEEPEYEYDAQADDLGVLNEVPDGASSFGVPTDAPSADIYAPPHAAVDADDESDEDGWEGDLDAEETIEYEQVLVGDGSESAETFEETEEYDAEAYAAESEEETQDEELEFAHAEDEGAEFEGEDDGSSSFEESESEEESFEPSYAAEEGVDFGAERSFAGAARPRRRMGALVTLGAGCVVAASLAVVLPVTGYLPFDVPYQVPQSWFDRVGLGSLVGIGKGTNAPRGAHVEVAAADPAGAAPAERAAETPASSAGEAEALAAAEMTRRMSRPEPEEPRSAAQATEAPTAAPTAPSTEAQVLEPAEVAVRVEEPVEPTIAPTSVASAQPAQTPAAQTPATQAPAAAAPAQAAPTKPAGPAVAVAPSPVKPSTQPAPAPVAAAPAAEVAVPVAESAAPTAVVAADAPIGPPPPALAGGVPMGPPVASSGVPSGPTGRASTLPGLPTERREGSIAPEEKGPNLNSPTFRVATSDDLGQRWTGTEVPPLSRIQAKFRMVTPNVGRVRVVTERGDVFDGRLDSMGESQVWLVMSLGTIAIAGETVARIDRLPEGPPAKGRAAATTSSERVRVKTAGGVLVGRVLSRDGDRVTILTDAGGRVTLVNPEIEPADQKVPGGVLGGRPPQ